MDNFTLTLSVSKIPVRNRREAQTVTDFEVREISLEQLEAIFLNHNHSPFIWKGGKRKAENCQQFTALAVDVDEGLTLDEALKMFSGTRCIIYTTTHHRKEKRTGKETKPACDRFRLLFPLPETLMVEAFPGKEALQNKFPFSDTACFEVGRQFFPSFVSQQVFEVHVFDGDFIEIPQPATPHPLPQEGGTFSISQEFRTAAGEVVTVADIEGKTQIHCPFHEDATPSAFIDQNERGHWYIHCSACDKTWWAERSQEFELSDLGNALRFAFVHRNKWRFNTTKNTWHRWTGKVWVSDGALISSEDIAAVRQHILNEGTEASLKMYHRLGNAKAIHGMLSLAERELQTNQDEFNKDDEYLLNTPTGIVNLKTGEMLQHDPELLITNITNVGYNPKAKCSEFEKWLRLIFLDNEDVVNYVQTCLGFAITGKAPERSFFLMQGAKGANGKSTLLEVIAEILGDYAGVLKIESLLTKKFDNNELLYQLSGLVGKRFVYTSEPKKNAKLDEGVLKLITGSDRIPVRFMYGSYFQMRNRIKLFMESNPMPDVDSSDEAVWDRIKRIRFDYQFPKEQRLSKDAAKRKLLQEAGGILNWLIRGAQRYFVHGLHEPAAVTEATDEYRQEVDVVSRFINEQCTTGKEFDVKVKALWEAYQEFCRDVREAIGKRKDFEGAIIRLGFPVDKDNTNTKKILGVKLVEKPAEKEF